jgi:lipopolysaccharide/colanic/teichoic acid biosynthesis glycosyltransferase
MRAVLIATGQNAGFYGLDESIPIPLLPLVDRPFLQHVVEYLVRQGVLRFDIVLCHLPEKIEANLGDGARWGCTFSYHLAPSEADAFRLAKSIVAGQSEPMVLGFGDLLPAFELNRLQAGSVLCREGVWTGWGVFASDTVFSDLEFGSSIESLPPALEVCPVELCLSLRDGDGLLDAQRAVLDGSFAGILTAGRQSEPGIWISRNVVLHPSVVVQPPVYIGENCRIGRGTRLGPSAAIGANCIVDAHSIVVNSLVSPGTYVGEGLELNSVIVNRNRLVNIPLGTSFLASDTFLLGNLTVKSSGRALQRLRDRVIALILLVFLWPLLLLSWILAAVQGQRFERRRVVCIPSEDDPAIWQTGNLLRISSEGKPGRGGAFMREFLPGLISVLQGSVFLVGVQPRSPQEVAALPSDWRSLYLKTKAGLITEAGVIFGPGANEDELYTGEAFYSASESAGYDLKLVAQWFWQLLGGTRPNASDPLSDSLD